MFDASQVVNQYVYGPRNAKFLEEVRRHSNHPKAGGAKMKNAWILVACVVIGLKPIGLRGAGGDTQEIFQIGVQDHSFAEFARELKPGSPVKYQVGTSSPSHDWYAYQPGAFDSEVGRSTREQDWTETHRDLTADSAKPAPFQVNFGLGAPPRGKFVLHLDAILIQSRPAAARYVVDINGHRGSYQMSPRPAPELWWPTGGAGVQYIGLASLDMPLPASYFLKGNNTLTVGCDDGFGIYYDDLSLRNTPAASLPRVISVSVEPTILYKTRESGLVELVQVKVRTSEPLGRTRIRVETDSAQVEKEVQQEGFGDAEVAIEVPEADHAVPVAVFVGGQKTAAYRGNFAPQRKWQVYAMPMEQADFGYNEVPSRTLEWENRYIDKMLDIMKEYPDYSFTLDASANLESYLSTHDETRQKQLIDYLRSGKFGMNGLYEHFFTGLATPEELFHMLEYSASAARQYGFQIDSAGQTDEPSETWGFPEILTAGGIKYFADGSDPIRAPFNPIGLLNFRSPFYWEGPNGSKLLTWSAVSYIAVDDMTWGGWNAESAKTGQYHPSLFGLEHSLPLFLSQYDRPDYPFDAVLLYGLHNDEIPIRHFGSADVIKMWNEEYAYPKIVPSTEHDFFGYVTEHFGEQIPTYRGDGGAYWEDEAGADARISAINRASQVRILAAEKLESIANWLQPFLRFDYTGFSDAWKNVMLADCYVWSDSNSFRRPNSYRTRTAEAAHRAWATTAYQQTWDLRLTAMDQIAELIKTDGPGAVVFNTESWERGGFFDFELESGEALVDPASGEAIPCGSMNFLNGYHDVRCWAAKVPPLGYKFYAIEKKNVVSEPVTVANAEASVDGKFYTLQLEPRTGALAHLVDKTTGQDLVNRNSGYGLNEYLYVTGGDPYVYYQGLEHGGNTDNRILASNPTLPLPNLTINRATVTKPAVVQRFPWGIVVTVHSQAVNTPQIVSTITLNDEQKMVTFNNEVDKTATVKKEGVYFAFPFAVREPRVEYQGATAWVNPVSDMLPGANRQWFTTQAGVRVRGSNQSIAWSTVDAPLITLEDINRGLWPATIEIRYGSVFSYAMNNYWYTDTPAQQGGHFTLRYALTSGNSLNQAETTKFALEQRSELLVLRSEHKAWKQVLPAIGAGFLAATPGGVEVLTIRPGAAKDIYLIRVENSSDEVVQAKLEFPMATLDDAHLGSPAGEAVGDLSWSPHEVKIPMSRYDIKTLVVHVQENRN
jgi:alpha-mannosidase